MLRHVETLVGHSCLGRIQRARSDRSLANDGPSTSKKPGLRTMLGRVIWLALVVPFVSSTIATGQTRDEDVPVHDAAGIDYFEQHIRPVLVQHCYGCHSSKAKSVKGNLLLDTRNGMRKGGDSGPAVVPGRVDESMILEALRHETFEMPPDRKLSDDIIAHFEHWIAIGAPDPRVGNTAANAEINLEEGRRFWAYQPLRDVRPPAGVQQHRETHEPLSVIDQFVYAALQENEMDFSERAEPHQLLRRAKYDLLGLPPTPAEILTFRQQPNPDEYARRVDEFLDLPQFGERWGRHWLDVARYAESMGRTRNVVFPFAWRYRNYVIDALNSDKPYNQFVQEQIAGDLLEYADAFAEEQGHIATGLLAIGSHDLNERNQRQFRMDVIDEQINTVTRAVLATTAACARCHDHKFDPIPTADYYALAGIFASTELRSGFTTQRGNIYGNYADDELLIALRGDSTPSESAVAAHARRTAVLVRQVRRTERLLAELDAPRRSGRNRSSTDRSERARDDDATASSASSEDFASVRAERQQLQQRLRRQRLALERHRNSPPLPPNRAMGVVEARRPTNLRIHVAGEIDQLGSPVPRGFLQVLCADGAEPVTLDGSGRRELAEWMTDPDGPAGALAARVMANRVWYHLFGRGLVTTVDNFGATGARPSHPELLEYLAGRLIEEGWSVKNLIREIMLSKTYQQSVVTRNEWRERDPDNVWLGRQNMRRLDVEAIRDAMLAVSGELDLSRPEGASVEPTGNGLANGAVANRWLEQSRHRSVYAPIFRSFIPTMFETFDFPEPSEVNGARDVTTVAPQALFMMNSPFVLDQSEAAGRRILRVKKVDNVEARITWAHLATIGRMPTAKELRDARNALRAVADDRHANLDEPEVWAWLFHGLFASAEFRYIE